MPCPIQVGDFRDLVPRMPGRPRLWLTDPPYNLDFDYGAVNDKRSDDEYNDMLLALSRETYVRAADDAHFMVIHYTEHFIEKGHLYLSGGWRLHRAPAWTYNGHAANQKVDLRRSHRTIMWMKKGNPPVFPERIPRPYRNPDDKRIKERIARGLTGAKPTDVFEVEQVKMGSREHKGYSNQIPEALLRQLILLTTEPGELVADPFSGTGSTARTALAQSREAWGCDLNPEAAAFWTDIGPKQAVLA